MKRVYLILILLSLAVTGARGQSIDELNTQIQSLRADIRETEALLNRTESDRQNNRSLLQIVGRKITAQRSLVTSLDQQVSTINREVQGKTRAVRQLEEELNTLKAEYAAMIRASYRSRQTNNVMTFLFASRDFHDITQRIYYIKRYTLMRERKAETIDSVSLVLQGDIAKLNVLRDSLSSVLQAQRDETTKLGRDEEEYRRIDRSLGSQATSYNNKIAQQTRQIQDLQNRIQRMIAEEARRSQTTERTAAEEQALVQLTGRFDENRGKLPYPVNGVIVEKYGSHPHPTQRGVTVNNKGVNIATDRGGNVRAVFEGDVVQIFVVPGMNNTVMIRHGSYFTTYSNLETVSVKVGDKVAINQNIGKIYSGPNAENYILLFTVSDGTKTPPQFMNPEQWLRR